MPLTWPLIQIAGVKDREEAALLIRCGVDCLGFPLRLTVNKEDLTEEDASRIIRGIPPPAQGVLITYLDRADAVLEFCAVLGCRAVQLHGAISAGELQRIRDLDRDLTLFKSLVIRTGNAAELAALAKELAPFVDAYITDTFDPATGAEGATGKTHDWRISRRLVEVSPRPVILAGGLNAENVREAILAVRPAGVDSHTGVEGPDGRKEDGRVRRFVQAARLAFSELPRS